MATTGYNPIFMPGDAIPFTASGTITGGDLVVVSGSGTVAKASTLAARNGSGVAGTEAAATGRVTVYGRGPVHESVADGAVTAGDELSSTNTASRTVKTVPTSAIDVGATPTQTSINNAVNGGLNTIRAIIGVALTTVADGQKVRWMAL